MVVNGDVRAEEEVMELLLIGHLLCISSNSYICICVFDIYNHIYDQIHIYLIHTIYITIYNFYIYI